MKRIIALMLSLMLLAGLSGCGKTNNSENLPPVSAAETASPSATEAVSHYTFQPKVCSALMEQVMGAEMKEAWYSLVDALMDGRDTFACSDDDTYLWMMGQFPERCFPVLADLICIPADLEDPRHPVIDGVGRFCYTVPADEARQRIDDFIALVEGILNQVLEADYTDFEKALALYIWAAEYFEYDYEAEEKMSDEYVDYLSCFRALTERKGVCQDISTAYTYLLMQAGVDATVMSGTREYDQAGHQWSYVRINGKTYHIDPTYVLGSDYSLEYFMMTDEQREQCDCYPPSSYIITSCYAQEHTPPVFTADDNSFEPLWDTFFVEFNHNTKKISCMRYDDNWEPVTQEFDYTEFE